MASKQNTYSKSAVKLLINYHGHSKRQALVVCYVDFLPDIFALCLAADSLPASHLEPPAERAPVHNETCKLS